MIRKRVAERLNSRRFARAYAVFYKNVLFGKDIVNEELSYKRVN
jgi:hypothetical protein